jgi:hypothetical protein
VLTANTITDEQIRELRDSAHAYGDGDPDFVVRLCNRALAPALGRAESRNAARVRCAQILNARKEG